MDHLNPYSAPGANLETEPVAELRLGERGTRLGAAIIDSLLVAGVFWALLYASGVGMRYVNMLASGDISLVKYMVGSMLTGFATFVVIQGYPLAIAGQTWGKRLLKLRIVDMQGRKPGFLRLILLRYGTGRVLGLIPFYALVDILFIFADDRRCLHDLIAGTRVVVAD